MPHENEPLIDQASRLERNGNWEESLKLYLQVANSDSEDAAYARNCAKIVQQRLSTAEPSVPRGKGVAGKAITTLIGVILLLGVGIAKWTARHGDDGAKFLKAIGLRGDGALRHLDDIPEGNAIRHLNDGLLTNPPHPIAPSPPTDPLPSRVDRAQSPDAEPKAIEVKDVDAKGLARDAADWASEHDRDGADWAAALKMGIAADVTTYSSRIEYRGLEDGDLARFQQESDEELIVSVGGVPVEKSRSIDRDLPDEKVGEFDRCRLRFSENGQPWFVCHERLMINDEPIDFEGEYALQFVDGSRTDYDAGKAVRLTFTPDGLERHKTDVCKAMEQQLAPVLLKGYSRSPAVEALVDGVNVRLTVDEWPQSEIVATRSTLVIEDLGVFAARVDVTAAPK